jgi:glycerol kinase
MLSSPEVLRRTGGRPVKSIVYDESTIAARVQALAGEITHAYPDGELLVLGLLKGSFIFVSDLVRQGRAAHPEGTEVDPEAWWRALQEAVARAGGLDDVAAVSVAGQQHGMVSLDEDGRVVRPALLWNDTRSAPDADDLVSELAADGVDGRTAWARAVGLGPVASYTVSKLRWLARNENDQWLDFGCSRPRS